MEAIYFPSLLLQVFLCSHQWFLHGFVLLSTLLFAYKCKSTFGYWGVSGLAGNVTLLTFYAVLENTRLYQSSKGNKTKQRAPLVLAVVLAAPALVCNSFLQLQPHVVEFERLINSIAIVLLGLEVLLAVLTLLWLFSKSTV
ncbi:Transmembrane protein 216 [Phytophthora ramorum]|uniref:Transmembrane protein 216 n=1 Tax=Phytophthora ramorum TaxID=164328 RepID=UPI0030A45CC3|nr:Transmembrane protein 216 [Phytophthora ramorum]